MPRRPRGTRDSPDAAPPAPDVFADEPRMWIRAEYTCHVFHYRMPETVAIASVNPVVPSPLTVKMALIASLLREGRIEDAERLAPVLPSMDVHISLPESGLVFRALLRYVRPPAQGSTQRIDANTGGIYGTNPHNREFALWGGPIKGQHQGDGTLSVFVAAPEPLAGVIEWALRQIGYLGAKDSLVTCRDVQRVEAPDPLECATPVEENGVPHFRSGNFVARLADSRRGVSVELWQLIPSQRDRRHYTPNDDDRGLYVLPGDMSSYGRIKFYLKRRP